MKPERGPQTLFSAICFMRSLLWNLYTNSGMYSLLCELPFATFSIRRCQVIARREGASLDNI